MDRGDCSAIFLGKVKINEFIFFTDYVGFIKKCMKQMQRQQYKLARKIDLEVERLDAADMPMSPGRLLCYICLGTLIFDFSISGRNHCLHFLTKLTDVINFLTGWSQFGVRKLQTDTFSSTV